MTPASRRKQDVLANQKETSKGASAMSDGEKPTAQPGRSGRPMEVVLFDFNGTDPAWYTVTDEVMGGISTSEVRHDPELQRLTFSGNLALENNGGFASIRSPWANHDLGAYNGFALRVRGDGKLYQFRIRTDGTRSGVVYTARFETEVDGWRDIYIPFSEMIPMYRGIVVDAAGPLDPASIRSFGLMLADKQRGEFSLQIDRVSAVANGN
jgi:NADH dehydrogenase [ubiquinone] 1 alpha subcomplex assembly factor 1